MGKALNIGLTLLILISVGLLCGSVALYIIKENELEKRISLERQLGKAIKEKETIFTQLEQLKEAKAKLELNLALKEKEVQSMQEKFELVSMEQGQLESERSSTSRELKAIREDFAMLREDFSQLQQAKDILEDKLKSMANSGIELEKIVVEPKSEDRTIEGEILAVNKEYEFLVVNLGLSSGVDMNSPISIYRDAELLAMGKIEKLYENISAVVVDSGQSLDDIKVGDMAIGMLNE